MGDNRSSRINFWRPEKKYILGRPVTVWMPLKLSVIKGNIITIWKKKNDVNYGEHTMRWTEMESGGHGRPEYGNCEWQTEMGQLIFAYTARTDR